MVPNMLVEIGWLIIRAGRVDHTDSERKRARAGVLPFSHARLSTEQKQSRDIKKLDGSISLPQ